MTPRKAVDKELSRERIVDAARALFARKGYHAISMRAIAEELGYTPGAFYYHFKEKAELFSLIVAEDFARLDALLAGTLTGPPHPSLSLLETILIEFIRFGLDNRHAFEIMFLIADPELMKYSQHYSGRSYDQFVAAVLKTSELPGTDPQLMQKIWALFISIRGFVQFFLHSQQSFEDVRSLAEVQVRMLSRGLA
ncbi:TetR/AcrR family transcriptional regulator [Paenibacillus silviterrae]|uniref:TetR/AcrR family transcriptional regulator n=1 Tax=Paenibacillus silviterrae TaxID=3242194 RepID=UPI0025427A5F|nr:TetR/AcrR family transcriptional regulator [Paenibacillus chinjuensis]